jgi:class 3 adenylate cyclase
VSKPLEALVLDLLAKDPEARPANAKHVRERLASLSQMAASSSTSEVREAVNPLDGLASGVFVGREEEMRKLRSGIDEALSGRARMSMLMGEPGIGKTRICEEVSTYASMRGAQVLWGRGYEGEGAPPYWPWVQIIRSYVHDCDPQLLMSEMGPAATNIAEVVSEVRARLPGLPEATPLDPEQARFRLFDGLVGFLRNASVRQPLVLVFDDLHCADKPSLMLLQFLARELGGDRLFVLATYRDVELGRQHPLSETLAELTRNNLCERVPLRGLGEADVARFIEGSAGIAPPPGLLAAVFRETEGNPFFVTEVVRLLASDRRLEKANEVASWSLEIPQGVREVVGRRLNGLSEDCNEALAVASVIGRDFEGVVLRRSAEFSEDRVLELIEEALSARLLQEIPGSLRRYRFSHALVRETLYEELSTPRRVRLHARVGEVLEEHHAGRSGSHLAEISHHAFQAIQTGNTEHAVAAARRAGDFARERLAYEEAALHYERAAQALEAADSPDPHELCELVVHRAELQQMAGETAAARETGLRAAQLAREVASAEHLARAAIAYGGFLVVEMGRTDETMVALGEEALAALGEADSSMRVRLLVRVSNEVSWSDTARFKSMAEEAIRVARRLGDPDALVYAFTAAVVPETTMESLEEGLRRADEVEAIARSTDNAEHLWAAFLKRRYVNFALGRREEFDRATDRAIELTEMGGGMWAKYFPPLVRAAVAILEGRFEEARPLVMTALQEGMRSWGQSARQFAAGQMMVILHHEKGLRADPMTLSLAERYPNYPFYASIPTFTYADSGDREACRKMFDHLAAENFENIPRDANFSNAMYFASHACVFLEDGARAKTLYGLLLPYAGIHAHLGAAFAYVGPMSHCLATLATLLGRFDDAERHFVEVLESLESMRAWPWLAENEYEFARMLLIRGAVGDRERALELLNRSLERAQQIGMTRLLERGLALKLEAQGMDSGSLRELQSIDVVAQSITGRKPDFARHAAPDGTVTLMFSDMQGFTAMTERLGDLKAREVIRDHNRIVRENLAAHGGYEVELLGDGFLLAFQSARRGLLCAIAIQRAFAAYSEAHPDEPIRVRIGLHTGEALKDVDKFFGKTVILAARIASQARGGEILASSLLKELTESTGDLRFGGAREVDLKGLSERQRVHAVEWE